MLIVCWSLKGGVGTSLLAAALTVRMQLRSRHPLLVDLDPYKADQTALLQCSGSPSLLDWPLACAGGRGRVAGAEATQALSTDGVSSDGVSTAEVSTGAMTAGVVTTEAVVRHPLGFHILPGPARPVAEGAVTQDLTERLLAALASGWRRPAAANGAGDVVLDLCSALRDSTLVSLERADLVLMVTTPDMLAARAAYQFSRELDLLGLDASRFRLVINRDGGRASLAPAELTELLPFPVAGRLPSVPRLAAAINQGHGARVLAGRNPYTRAVDQMLTQVLCEG